MKPTIILFTCLLTLNLSAQNIINAEYFIDSDPGFGNGTQIPITAAPDIALNFSVDLNTINDGFHVLYFRAKDDSSRWSIAYSRAFYKESLIDILPDITGLEYFIDTDPGFGNGTAITITPGEDITVNYSIDLNALNDGFHVLYVRGKDSDGKWSIAYSKPFYKKTFQDVLTNITHLEYFIDSDPGFGNGVDVPITAGIDISQIFMADLSGLDDGFHILYVRGMDERGIWSLAYSKPFYKEVRAPLTNITELEYYFSNVDTVTSVYNYSGFIPAPDVDISFGADISALAKNTSFYFHIYGRDSTGLASIEYTHEFFVESSNVPPAVANHIPDVNLDEDFGIFTVADLDTVFTDPDIPFGDSLRYTVSVSNGFVNANLSASILQLTSVSDSNGVAQVIVRARDDSLASARDTFQVTLNPVNDQPVILGNFPNPIEFQSDSSFVFDLDTVVTDLDDAVEVLDWAVFDTSVVSVQIDQVSHECQVSYSQLENAVSDTIYFTVTDSSFASDTTESIIVNVTVVGIDELADLVPRIYSLDQNYPNPFNPITTIRFELPKNEEVQLIVYDILGRKVATLVNEKMPAGKHELVWNTANNANGFYFCQLTAGKFREVKKMLLVK